MLNYKVSARDYKHKDSNSRLFNNSGEVDASSSKDLSQVLLELSKAIQRNEVTMDEPHEVDAKIHREEAKKNFLNIYRDRSSTRWSELGATLAADLKTISDRQGFMRQFLFEADVDEGTQVRHRVQRKQLFATIATAPTQYRPQFVEENYIYVPEFEVKEHMLMSELNIVQSPGDILQEKFFECQESIMIQEDRTMIGFFEKQTNVANPVQYLAGGLTPNTLALMQSQIQSWNLTAANMLISVDVQQDIFGSTQFASWFDQASKYEIIKTGKITELLGMSILTEAFRDAHQKVMEPGTVYITAPPAFLGAYTERGPLNSIEVNGSETGIVARGFLFWEILSMALHNPRAVVKGKRS